jgi:putative acid phosphatase of HAD superfamily subfamily IIIB
MPLTVNAVASAVMPFAVVALLVAGLPAPAAHADDAPLGCPPRPEAAAEIFSQPPNYDLAVAALKRSLVAYRCTAYEADIAKALDEALAWVKVRAPEVVAAGGAPAIVLDIDETSLSNWTRIYRDSFDYISAGACDLNDNTKPCGDLAWQRSGKAPAIGPTLALYKFARCIEVAPPCKPIEVFFITGRKEDGSPIDNKTPRQWTRDNLIGAGYADVADDHLFLRLHPDTDGGVADYKSGTRASIETTFQVRIIANIGDQFSDLAKGHADRPFKVPNPFYFIPP